MTPRELERRLKVFEQEGEYAPMSVIVVPEVIDHALWALAVLISKVEAEKSHGALGQCTTCGYPMPPESECAACGIERTPEPRRAFEWPKSGIARVPWRWTESNFLKATQKAWCLSRGVASTCPRCDWPLANAQAHCLICLNARFYI